MVDREELRALVQARISANAYRPDARAHIELRQELCQRCSSRPCLWACPANLYEVRDDGRVHLDFEGCLECGTCRLVCPEGALRWDYPRGGFGVRYRFG